MQLLTMNVVTLFLITLCGVVQCFDTEYESEENCGIMNPNGEHVRRFSDSSGAKGPMAIVGGEYAREGEFPFQVNLKLYLSYWPLRWKSCGGTVISKRCVLTAAHCFFKCPEFKVIRVEANFGVNDLNDEYRQSLTSYDFVTHEGFKPCVNRSEDHDGNDIAVVRFTEDISMGMTPSGKNSVGTVCLPFGNISDSFIYGVTAGWGKTELGGAGPGSSRLKFGTFSRVIRCAFPTSYTQICAANQFRDQGVCKGDSGGPLLMETNGRATQVGVASYASKGCRPGGTIVFNRVKPFETWIRKNCGM